MQNRRGFLGRVFGAVAAAVVAPFVPAAAPLTFRGVPLITNPTLGVDISAGPLSPEDIRDLVNQTLQQLGKTSFRQIATGMENYQIASGVFGRNSERA